MAEEEEGKVFPLSELLIASHEPLRNVDRQPCPKCKASRKYYCYTCHSVVGLDRSLIPTVSLPVPVHIIKHQQELVGKSTATHACILAPTHVTQYDFPTFPDVQDKKSIILVFPSETHYFGELCQLLEHPTLQISNAISLRQLGQQCREDKRHIEGVIFIDSTWQQSNKIINDERLEGIQKVKLEEVKTYFWRPQRGKPDTCLATIEAIYYFFKEYHEHVLQREYEGEYDNLLYFFVFQYNLIQEEKAKRDRHLIPTKRKKVSEGDSLT